MVEDLIAASFLLSLVTPTLGRLALGGRSGSIESLWLRPCRTRTAARSTATVAATAAVALLLAPPVLEGLVAPAIHLGGVGGTPQSWWTEAAPGCAGVLAAVSMAALGVELWLSFLLPSWRNRPSS